MRNKLFILAFLAVFYSADAFGFDYLVNGIYYSLLGGDSVKVTYSIKGDNNKTAYSGAVTIPSTVRLGGVWRRVVCIGDSAFYNCSSLTSITMPNSIKKVGVYAFNNCTGLTSVSLSDSVTILGNGAFYGCSKLPSISLPNSLKRICPYAFANCSTLVSIIVPDSIRIIEHHLFYFCDHLSTVVLPEGIIRIDASAFNWCARLKNINWPSSLKKICAFALANGGTNGYHSVDASFENINLPEGLDTIENYAFLYRRSLKTVLLPNSVRFVGYSAFKNCSNITTPVFNDKIFAYLPNKSGYSTYSIPSGITTIAAGACYNNSYLISITIPNSVKYISNSAFYGCIFNTVNMSDSIEYIGDSAFLYCSSLPSISLPKTTTNVRYRAFYGCSILNRVELHPSTPPSFGTQCFYNVPGNFFVPCDSLVPYQNALAQVSVAPSRVFGNPYSANITSANNQQGTVNFIDQPYTCPDSLVIFQAVPNYGSTFVRWSDGNTANPRTIRLTSDTTLQAIFKYNKYTVTTSSVYGTVSGGGTYDFGTEITLTATPIDHYHFENWNDGSTNPVLTHTVHNDTMIVAYFAIDRFAIVFANYDNSELQRDTLIYGTLPAYRGATPTRPATAKFTYTFKGWSEVIDYATENKKYVALYDSVIATHTIAFVNYDGTELQNETLNYGVTPVYKGVTPTKPANVRCTYTFKGWDPAIGIVTRDTVYVAQFDSTINKYTVTFVNYDGTTLQSGNVSYGTMPTYSSATPTKPATAQYTYTFKGWKPAIVAVTGAATYTAQFDSTVNSYLVKFVNHNGTVLQSETLQYGAMPQYRGTTPSISATAQYTFTFKGWNPAISTVTEAVTYKAQFDTIINQYVITFKNHDGTELQKDTLNYGVTPVYRGSAPTKTGTAKYAYTFKGWKPAISSVTKDASYVAQFDSTINKYTITFVNYDGTTLQSTNLNYGKTPTYSGTTPIKPATAQYTYTFRGWDPAIATVTGTATYTAQFDSTVNRYTVKFVNYNGTLLQSGTLPYGDMPRYTGTTPSRSSTAKYTFTFIGWSPEIATVTGAVTYTAQFDTIIKQYTITFVNYDNTTLQSGPVDYDAMPQYTGATPTKPSSAKYDYTFKGWNPTLTVVTGAKTYKAQYDSVIRKYTIKFVNYDGETLQSSEVDYNVIPTYTGATPTKPATAQYTYTFKNWSPAIVKVTGAAIYTAQYDSTVNRYSVTFVNFNGAIIQSGQLQYGSMPQFHGMTPTRAATAKYTYTFKGWTPALAEVTGNAVYTAEYDSVIRKYTIAFVNYDGTSLQSSQIDYEIMPEYTGATPTRPATAQYTFTFSGWHPAVTTVTGAATYTAQYDTTVNQYSIAFVNYDGTTLQNSSWDYGETPQYLGQTPVRPANAQYTYSFKGWNPAITSVTGQKVYTAAFDSVINQYQVAFVNHDGATLQNSSFGYGSLPVYSGITPTKAANVQYTYVFKGWTPAIVTVTGAATYTAQYDSVLNQYSIAFVNYDGTTLQSGLLNYGATPVYTGATPIKAATAQYTYSFKGWTPAIAPVAGTATYTAQYDSVLNLYNVSFVNYDGSSLQSQSYYYGTTPAYIGQTPTRPADAQYTYTFREWTPAITTVTGNAVYTAVYDSTINQYPISFVNHDGTVLQTGNMNYGETPQYNGATPSRAATAYYTYSFKGWNPAIAPVTAAAIYTATYDSVANQFLVTFLNYDGTTLQSGMVNTGVMPTYTGTTPTKPSTVQYTYTFREWSPAVVPVIGDATYTAVFDSTVNQYTISVIYNTSEGIITGGGTYDYGTSVTLTATAADHYHFVNWGNSVTTPVTMLVVTGDSAIYPVFEIDQYTVTAISNNEEYGTVTGGGSYDYGSVVTLTAVANEHYKFVRWSDGSTTPTITFVVTGTMVLTAEFQPVQHQVMVIANYNSRGTVTGGGTYDYGTTVTVTATPNEGYEFTGWSNGETSNILTFVVEGDTTLTANFEPIEVGVENTPEVEYVAYTQGMTIFVHGASDQKVYVYDMSGQLVAYEDKASEETSFQVYNCGIYVVKIGDNKTVRVVVK